MEDHQTPEGELRDTESVKRAIRSVGRTADSDQARARIIEAAATLGHSDLVPDGWERDGSLRGLAWTQEIRETYTDTFTALDGAVTDAMGDDDDYCFAWVQDFTDTEVIFYYDGNLWSVGYTLEPGGAVTLTGDPVKVRPVTSYVERKRDQESVEYRRHRAEILEGVREVRRFDANNLEVRETTDGMLRFSGYASVTERAYEVGEFEETIARGAFKRTLSEQPDVVLLVNHGEGGGLPLARTKSGTMTLTEDARGLRVDADLNPADPDVKALVPKLERGDVDEMSFAFRVTDQAWSEDYTERTIRGVALNKGDVSIVTYGANDASTGGLAGIRALADELEQRAGKTLSAKTRGELEQIKESITSLLDTSDQSESDTPAPEAERSAPPAVIPDYTTRARERLAQLRRAA